MKILVKYEEDYGRMGDLDGLFVTTPEEFQELKDYCLKKTYGLELGEVLGKHSEVYVKIDEKNSKIISDDQDFIAKLLEVFGQDADGYFISGQDVLGTYRDIKEYA